VPSGGARSSTRTSVGTIGDHLAHHQAALGVGLPTKRPPTLTGTPAWRARPPRRRIQPAQERHALAVQVDGTGHRTGSPVPLGPCSALICAHPARVVQLALARAVWPAAPSSTEADKPTGVPNTVGRARPWTAQAVASGACRALTLTPLPRPKS
jgi:hypothetical protein